MASIKSLLFSITFCTDRDVISPDESPHKMPVVISLQSC